MVEKAENAQSNLISRAFLEHSRVYIFGRMASARLYSSAIYAAHTGGAGSRLTVSSYLKIKFAG